MPPIDLLSNQIRLRSSPYHQLVLSTVVLTCSTTRLWQRKSGTFLKIYTKNTLQTRVPGVLDTNQGHIHPLIYTYLDFIKKILISKQIRKKKKKNSCNKERVVLFKNKHQNTLQTHILSVLDLMKTKINSVIFITELDPVDPKPE